LHILIARSCPLATRIAIGAQMNTFSVRLLSGVGKTYLLVLVRSLVVFYCVCTSAARRALALPYFVVN